MALFIVVILPASARDNYTHDVSVLPDAAKNVIKNNFKADISVIKIDKDFGIISEYEVILTDGTEISFDSKGNWDNIETRKSESVPNAFVLQPIQDYVSKNQPGIHIVGIDRERSGYEIELSNGIEMKFDKAGNFKRYD